jgi:hypothetical protein
MIMMMTRMKNDDEGAKHLKAALSAAAKSQKPKKKRPKKGKRCNFS